MHKFEIMEPNPAWADKILVKHWDAIEAKVGRQLMPNNSSPSESSFDELGCGNYGCVYATRERNNVFKITSDVTEAVFISCAMQLGDDYPREGIVTYGGVWEIPGAKYKNRRIFVLTREEAYDVGGMRTGGSEGDVREYANERMFLYILGRFKEYSSIARDKILKSSNKRLAILEADRLGNWAEDVVDREKVSDMSRKARWMSAQVPGNFTGARGIAYAVRACKILSELMSNGNVGHLIGSTLHDLIRCGLLLADVHADNIGRSYRGQGDLEWIITDPGHVVPLRERWLDVQVASI